jgi:N-acetyl-anhydromuramyl-L-alanine amidase AmpD
MTITETPTRKVLVARPTPPICFVLHTTGDTDLAKILRYYTSADKDACQPHWMIETSGRIHRIAPEDKIASHCAIRPEEAALYAQGFQTWSRYLWNDGQPRDTGSMCSNYIAWRDIWLTIGVQSPLELITGRRPNTASVGIELQEPEHYEVDKFTDAQYSALADVLAEGWRRWKIPMKRNSVLLHSDTSPLRRTNAKGPTDPGRGFNFNRIWDTLRGQKPVV